jgi:hypothetical protein
VRGGDCARRHGAAILHQGNAHACSGVANTGMPASIQAVPMHRAGRLAITQTSIGTVFSAAHRQRGNRCLIRHGA